MEAGVQPSYIHPSFSFRYLVESYEIVVKLRVSAIGPVSPEDAPAHAFHIRLGYNYCSHWHQDGPSNENVVETAPTYLHLSLACLGVFRYPSGLTFRPQAIAKGFRMDTPSLPYSFAIPSWLTISIKPSTLL